MVQLMGSVAQDGWNNLILPVDLKRYVFQEFEINLLMVTSY